MMSESKLRKGCSGLSDLHADADGGVALTQKYLASINHNTPFVLYII